MKYYNASIVLSFPFKYALESPRLCRLLIIEVEWVIFLLFVDVSDLCKADRQKSIYFFITVLHLSIMLSSVCFVSTDIGN